jgi:type VI secretion system secreted protein VgrG
MSAITGISTDLQLILEGHADAPWRVLGATLRERLSEPYRAEVMLHVHGELELDALLGVSGLLVARRREHEQRLAGVVTDARLERVGTRDTLARLTLCPALWLLRHRKDSRIFQGRTVPEILRDVLEPVLAAHQRELRLELDGSYLPREHTVQYRETDLAFAQRLMEEAGIVYAFDHAGEREVLVLTDRNAQHPALVGRVGEVLPYDEEGGASGELGDDSITSFASVTSLVGGRVTGLGFDWTRPSQPATAQAEDESDPFGLEWYDHELPLTLDGFAPRQGYAQHDATALIGRLHELQVRDRRVMEGTSNALSPRAGFHLTLEGHPRPELDARYLVVESEHRFGSAVAARDGAASDEAQRDRSHHCRFTCVPSETPWRPARVHDRPRIASVQTATVVGPAGEEIHTDEHGRIKVRFHWDRRASGDERSSTWIRVAQSMGGPGWGFSFIPRIGMEVVVTFVQGDPDKPLVTGVVYNGETPPPYDPSVESTRTTIKTDSSPGHGGYHELRFEDRAGAEELYLRSQKDWNIVIENDSTREVKRDEREHVARDRERQVGHDEQLEVTGDREKTVGANQTEVVKGNRQRVVGVDESVSVGGAQAIEIAATSSEAVAGKATMQVTGAFTETVVGELTTTISKDAATRVGGDESTQVAGSQQTSVVGNVKSLVGDSKSVRTGADSTVKTGGTRMDTIGGSRTLTSGPATQRTGIGSITSVGMQDILNVTLSHEVTIDGADDHVVGSKFYVASKAMHSEEVGGLYSVQAAGAEAHTVKGALRFLVANKVEIVLTKDQIAFAVADGKLDVDASGSVTLDGAQGVWLTSVGETKLEGKRVSLADPTFTRQAACRTDPLEYGITVDPGGGVVEFAGLHPALVLDPVTMIPKPGELPTAGHVATASSKVFVANRGAARELDMCLMGGPGSSAAGRPVSVSPELSEMEKARLGEAPKWDGPPGGESGEAVVDTKLGPVKLKVLEAQAGLGGIDTPDASASFFAGLRGSLLQASVPIDGNSLGPLAGRTTLGLTVGETLLGGGVVSGFDPATATSYFSARAGAEVSLFEVAATGTLTITPFDSPLFSLFLDRTDPRARMIRNIGVELSAKVKGGIAFGAKGGVDATYSHREKVARAEIDGGAGLGVEVIGGLGAAAGLVGTAGLVKILKVPRNVYVG